MSSELQQKTAAAERAILRPRVDVFENDVEYLVVADVPGVAKEALVIHFEDGELRIAGRRAPQPSGALVAQESRVADFERAFAMPDGIDAERIVADLASGVLRVRLPKAASKRVRRIDVRAS